jgi:histidine triad (HIT) family protein
MENVSEHFIRENCPHCDPNSFALKHPLKETDNFWVVCDVHPIAKGHVLIIPKAHVSCIGEYPPDLYREFIELYSEFSRFIEKAYGGLSTFEHGKVSQTVFHSHVHIVPFKGTPQEIIPEGENTYTMLKDMNELIDIYNKKGSYLFFSIRKDLWVVDTSIAAPRFFRDRFAKAFGEPEKGNWKEMRSNETLMSEANQHIKELEKAWLSYLS